MRKRHALPGRPIADQVGQTVRVLHRSWHLDTARNVVVGKAQLVGQLLYLKRIRANTVVHDDVVGRRDDTYSALLTYHEEVVAIGRNKVSVNHSAWLRVAQSTRAVLKL